MRPTYFGARHGGHQAWETTGHTHPHPPRPDPPLIAAIHRTATTATLVAAVPGLFVITLDSLVVSVALPDIRDDLGGGITGLQWVIDGYTLMFAALLLSTGSLSDRVGARRAFATGMVVFVAASAACDLAPNLAVPIAPRLAHGSEPR
jgi:DHA2 family methylenomycin A resistance protein-like MFS transporter